MVPDGSEKPSYKLTWAEILERCKRTGLLGCSVDAAITAHQFASERHLSGTVAQNALQAVALAVGQSPEEDRRKLNYLSNLPQQAWESYPIRSAFDMRELVLSMVRGHLAAWMIRVRR